MILIVTSSFAKSFANERFIESPINKVTVAQALKMNDNSYITIQGRILKKVAKDEYLFSDSTGTIVAEIDNDKWVGISVNKNDLLELKGEIEKEYNGTKIDVDYINKICN